MNYFFNLFKDFFNKDFFKYLFYYFVFVFLSLIFAYFLLSWGSFLNFDKTLQESIFSFGGDKFTSFMIFITNFGDKIIIFPLVILISLYLLFKKRTDFLFVLLSSSFVSAVVVYSVKILFARERPYPSLIEVDGFSFPSGHAIIAVAFYGALSYFAYVSAKKAWERFFSVLLGVALIFLVSFSRVYLGVHFPSDVFFAIIFAGVWLGFLIYFLEKRMQKK